MTEYLHPGHYLPHKPPMCLLDRVIDATDRLATCSVECREGGVLDHFRDEDGTVGTEVLVELMAQTIGVWSGVRRIMHPEESVEGDYAQIGLLLSVRSLEIAVAALTPEMTLTISMRKLIDESRLSSFEGEVREGDRVIATGRLNVFQPNVREFNELFGENHS